MSSPWILVTARVTARATVRVAAFAFLVATFVASFVAGCGTPQKGGPRRMASDDDEDAGAPVAASCDEITCAAPATCIRSVQNGIPRASCECPKGFREEKGRCVDVDECARPEDNNCDANATCENREGTFTCRCKPGFGLDGDVCKSLNSCVGAENTCHPLAACSLNAVGGVDCKCGAGLDGDGFACTPADPCASGAAQCADNARCEPTGDSYTCTCGALFTGNGMTKCTDRCDDAQNDATRCDPNGRGNCVIGPVGAATCTSCNAQSTGDGRTCTAEPECAALNCGANTVCAGTAGARSCACREGFSGDPLTGCQDIDECAANTAECDPATSRCLNTPGSYVCECKSGFARDPESGACSNVDECAANTDRCDVAATCIDKSPGYSCQCKEGYELAPDGLSCKDIDECKNGTGMCRADDPSVVCVNTRGSFDCRCPKGYAGDGVTEACYCDMTGWWAMREDATLAFPARTAAGQTLVTASTTYASVWELMKLRYDGEKIVVERKACGSDVAPEIYSPLYMETYSSWTPPMVLEKLPLAAGPEIPLPKKDALPGNTFTTPRYAIVQGLKMNDPLNDPWPAKYTDIPADRWVDFEDDGEPGVSLWPIGTTQPARTGKPGETLAYLPVALEEGTTKIDRRLGCASVALRTRGAMRLNIDSCDRMSGMLLDTQVEGRVHSCTVLRQMDWDATDVSCTRDDWKTQRDCMPDEVQFLDEQDQMNTSSATLDIQKLGPLDGPDQDCAAVRAKLPAIVRNR